MIHPVCSCGAIGHFHAVEEAFDAGWRRIKVHAPAERAYWFCPREPSTCLKEALDSIVANGDQAVQEGRLQEES